jgi:hypothetical protein
MIRRRIGVAALAAVLALGSGALPACKGEEQKEIERLEDDVGRELDKLRDKIEEDN